MQHQDLLLDTREIYVAGKRTYTYLGLLLHRKFDLLI